MRCKPNHTYNAMFIALSTNSVRAAHAEMHVKLSRRQAHGTDVQVVHVLQVRLLV